MTLAADGSYKLADTDTIVSVARERLTALFDRGAALGSPQLVRDFLTMKLARVPYEVFAVIFLDCSHAVIEYREMFRGTLTQTSVYPREIVKAALQLNAAAVVLAHQHPSSGNPEPSRADALLTKTLKAALELIDVRVLDHVVVGGGSTVSFAERGLL